MSKIKFSKDEKDIIVGKIKLYFTEELDHKIGQFDAEFLLDFFSTAYDGDSDIALLTGTDTLIPGQSGTLILSVNVAPSTSTLVAENQIMVSADGEFSNDPVDDLSNDGDLTDPTVDSPTVAIISGVIPIPALSWIGLSIMAILLALFGWNAVQRKQP